VSERAFKVLGGFFMLLVLLSICNKRDRQMSSRTPAAARYDVTVQTAVSASEGLNLAAVGELLKKAKDAQELERLLNSANNGVNNLDLDEDGSVDYIYVTEYGDNRVKGFSLTTQPKPGETQEIATIEIEKAGSEAQVQIQGNQQIYGQNQYYRSSFGLTDFLILSWLFRPHPLYASPWGYGRYPSYYSRPRTRASNDYNRDMRRATRGSTFSSSSRSQISSSAKSPNAGKSASSIKAPLKNPTSAQKQFQARNPSRQVRSGGFGRSTNRATSRSTTTRSTSVRRSAPSRSRSFSGGGK